MPVMFDPNQDNFQAQNADVERQKMLAMALRKQAMGAAQPQGQMVGDRYVQPHWMERLVPIFQQLNAGWAESEASKANKGYQKSVGDAQTNWQSSLPSIVPGSPGRPELPGPPEQMGSANGGSPELAAVAPVPAQIPSRTAILQKTLEGMRIPGNEAAAGLWNKGMSADLEREDTQVAKREDRAAQSATKLQEAAIVADQRMREALIRSEDTQLSATLRAEAAREATQARLELGRLMREVARDKANTPKPGKPLDLRVHKDLSAMQDKYIATEGAQSSFKPEFGGMSGLAKTVTGTYIPGVNTEAAEWWKNYRKNTQLVERHAMFGSALTMSEKGAWRAADIEPQMNPELIRKNLETRAKLTAKMYNRSLKRYADAGHNVEGVFDPVTLSDDGTPDSPAAPTAAPSSKPPMGAVQEDGKWYVNKGGKWVEWTSP